MPLFDAYQQLHYNDIIREIKFWNENEMIYKYVVIGLSVIATIISQSVGIVEEPAYKVSEIKDYIEDNLNELSEEYMLNFDEKWNVNRVENYHYLYDVNYSEPIAIMIEFNQGYLTVDKDFTLVDINIHDGIPLANSNIKTYLIGNSYFRYDLNEGFVTNDSHEAPLNQISGKANFEDIYGEDIYKPLINYLIDLDNPIFTHSVADDIAVTGGVTGDYNIYTRSQFDTDCGPQAALNLIYTYDLSGVNNLAISYDSIVELYTLRWMMGWPNTSGILGDMFVGTYPNNVEEGLNTYLPNNMRVQTSLSKSAVSDAPKIGLYANLNVINTAHYAMIVGRMEADAWWIFKDHYDIIAHWYENHNHENGMIQSKQSHINHYYYVNRNYRHYTFAIEELSSGSWDLLKIN